MKLKYVVMLGILFLGVIILAPLFYVYSAHIRMSIPPFAVPSSTSFEGYGMYESCSPKDEATCLSHLNTMAAAGFQLVINYDEMYGDAGFQKAYLDRAQSVGMKVIIALNNPAFYTGKNVRSKFPALAETCNCTDNTGFLRYVVNLVRHHPAVWGYYIGDEVDPGDHDDLKSALADVIHQLDPTHPRLFIDSAGHPVAVWRGNSPFFDTAEVIGSDFYPVRDASSEYPSLDQTAAVASSIQAYANAHGEGGAIVLQAFSRSQYGISGEPYPTADQMEQMLSQTLTHSHPRMILWYSYYDTMSSENAAQNWNNLKATLARHRPKN